MFISEQSSSHRAQSHAGLSSVFCRIAGVDALSRAPREVEQLLAALLNRLHERVAPNYRPREIILEMLAMLEAKSDFTAQHSLRVATVARAIAKTLNLDVLAVERVSLAALLHDVGKLVIPDRILEKKAVLSDAERRCVQTHAAFTSIILAAFPVFDSIRTIASQHHEHLNGTGYPFGVTGDGLAFETRIITIADIFVALTEDRPYRAGVSNDAALHKLNMLAGEDIVDAEVLQSAQQVLLAHRNAAAIWYPSRTSISVALDFDFAESSESASSNWQPPPQHSPLI